MSNVWTRVWLWVGVAWFKCLYVWILEYNNVHYFGIMGAYRWEIGGEIVNDMEDDTTSKNRTMKLIDITIWTILREISRTTFPLKETRYRGNTKEDNQPKIIY